MPRLFIVATPIGNLSDISARALQTLRDCDLIAAEDTRVTRALLNHFEIDTPCVSNHQHNEENRAAPIVARMLEEDLDVALVTDAGTPCISDPGSALVHEAVRAGIEAVAVPGPTAMASALSVSGFEVSEFTFFGFLPRQKNELREKLTDMARRSKLAVAHESPHRVCALLAAVAEQMPHTLVSASCDLTKKFEKTLRGPVTEVLSLLEGDPKAEKGEYCLVFCWDERDIPAPEAPKAELSLEAQLFDGIVRGLSLREAMEELVARGERKNAVYAASLRVKEYLREADGR